jgi:hydrogenase maturation protease
MMRPRTLILGWGNPGRGDDGLGPAFADEIAALGIPDVDVASDYQLQVESAEKVAHYRRVLFVDADRGNRDEPFWLGPLEVGAAVSPAFSTHGVSPETILALSRDLFHQMPEAWLMGIRGYEFESFVEQLSWRAFANLMQAVDFIQSALQRGDFGKGSES